MDVVDKSLLSWRQQLQYVYAVTSEISNLSSELKEYSKKIELLVSNGTVQASRVGEGGKVFAVLAKELSRIPDETKKNVDEVSKVTISLTEYSTECLNVIRKLSQYLKSLSVIHGNYNPNEVFSKDFLYSSDFFIKKLNRDGVNIQEKENIGLIVNRYLYNNQSLLESVKKSLSCIQNILFCTKSLKNTGVMAEYMGLNFASEAVKCAGADYFLVLSKYINELMNQFMSKIRNMEDLLEGVQKQLNIVMKH